MTGLEVFGRPAPLPAATAEDFGRVERPEQLRTPGAWQEWLGEHTGRMALVSGKLVAETNYMARAEPGGTTNGFVKTAEVRDGCPVWGKVT